MKRSFARIILGAICMIVVLLLGVWLGESSATHRYQAEFNIFSGLDEHGVRVDRMSEFYSDRDPFVESAIKTDLEFRTYCQEENPQAIYPSTEWTSEEVLQSYYDTPEVWGKFTDRYSMQSFFFTWTPDYEHCFILDDNPYAAYESDENPPALTAGWLCVDGVRVKPYGQKVVESLNPFDLARAYQAGEWNGDEVWSADLSTCAYLDNWDGGLTYRYEAWRYDETTDPLQLAYQDFAWQPWWQQKDFDAEAIATIDQRYRHLDLSDNTTTQARSYVNCNVYLDLPIKYDTSVLYSTIRLDNCGTFCITPTSIELYNKGELLEIWNYEFDPQHMSLMMPFEDPPTEYADDLAYLYDGEQLLALRSNDQSVIMIDYVCDASISNSEFWGFCGNQFVYWSLSSHFRSRSQPEFLAKDVLEVDFSTLRLFTKADGCYLVSRWNEDRQTYSENYQTFYLGTEPMNYYVEMYRKLRSSSTSW